MAITYFYVYLNMFSKNHGELMPLPTSLSLAVVPIVRASNMLLLITCLLTSGCAQMALMVDMAVNSSLRSLEQAKLIREGNPPSLTMSALLRGLAARLHRA